MNRLRLPLSSAMLFAALLSTACTGSTADGLTTGDTQKLDDAVAGEVTGGGGDTLDLAQVDVASEALILAGVGVTDITPDFEPYTDLNANQIRDPDEPFEDLNENGQFDTLEMGGFGLRHPTAVLHPLTARALALRVHGEWFVLVAVDSLGIGIGRSEEIRDQVMAALDPAINLPRERLLIANIHTHAAPDTMGIFGEMGVDQVYIEKLVHRTAEAITIALAAAEPASLAVTHADVPEAVRDIDPPNLTDPYVGIIQVRRPDGSAIATLMSIANHPETFWKENTRITPDYPHYLRTAIEEHEGGTAFYFSADLGLMQSPEEVAEKNEPRAMAVATLYSDAVLAQLDGLESLPDEALAFAWQYRTVPVVLENPELYIGLVGGMLDGYDGWLYKTEEPPCDFFGCLDLPVATLRLGDAVTLVSLPGEFVPELILGGITLPEVYDGLYPDAPDEPVMLPHIQTKERFLLGLSGMDCGYVYPKKQHDPKNHFSQSHTPGPNAAMNLMTAVTEMLDALNAQ